MFAEHYARYYDLLNSKKSYKKEIRFVYNWAEKPEWIFDIGCGTASYWKYYPVGTNLVGVDQSPFMAKRKNIVCADIQTFKPLAKNGVNCATALFDVINYIPDHGWWCNIPLEKGGYFIFDIWDKDKVDRDGFQMTIRRMGDVCRVIRPLEYNGKSVLLKIQFNDGVKNFKEEHRMYIYSHKDIERFDKGKFDIVEVKETETWQKWYKLKRK